MAELAVLLNGNIVARAYEEGAKKLLAYDPEVLFSLQSRPYLSMSMPPRTEPYSGRIVENWLWNLLPDNERTLQWIAHNMGPHCSSQNPLRILEKIGEECSGSVQLVPFSRVNKLKPGSLIPLSPEEVERKLKESRTGHNPLGLLATQDKGYFSLAGAQPKLALRKLSDGTWASAAGGEPTSHILKPPMADYPEQIEGEHFCLELARLCGLPSATSELVTFGSETALAVERFDRKYDEDGAFVRLHVEDMCQALGYSPRNKYQSEGGPGIEKIAMFLRQNAATTFLDARVFFRACIFNWLIGGTDAHAKNYSVFLASGKVVLAPLYDLNTLLPYERDISHAKLSMSVAGQYQFGFIQIKHWQRMAELAGLSPQNAIEDIFSCTQTIIESVLSLGENLSRKNRTYSFENVSKKIYERANKIFNELIAIFF